MVISKISGSESLVSILSLCACDVDGDTLARVVHVVESVLLPPLYEFQGFNSGCWIFAGSAFAH